MRIDRLKLVDFKNLKDFKIDFDESQPTTIVLGRNGSGKSNLIEALIEIFRDLEEGKVSGFPYEIEYLCHNHRIVVANDPKNKKRQEISVDGGGVSRSEFAAMLHEVLPKHIFAYYSGWNRRLETGFDRPTRKLYRLLVSFTGIGSNMKIATYPLEDIFTVARSIASLSFSAFS